MASSLKRFVLKTLSKVVRESGTLVPKDQGDARVKICHGCDRFGKVLAEVGLETEGCTICRCPSVTKPYMETYWSLTKGKIVKAVCPHEDGNLWAEVDKQFLEKLN